MTVTRIDARFAALKRSATPRAISPLPGGEKSASVAQGAKRAG